MRSLQKSFHDIYIYVMSLFRTLHGPIKKVQKITCSIERFESKVSLHLSKNKRKVNKIIIKWSYIQTKIYCLQKIY